MIWSIQIRKGIRNFGILPSVNVWLFALEAMAHFFRWFTMIYQLKKRKNILVSHSKVKNEPCINHWLITGWWLNKPVWKISVNWDDHSQYMGKQKMLQTTNQSMMIYLPKIWFSTSLSIAKNPRMAVGEIENGKKSTLRVRANKDRRLENHMFFV